MLPARAIPYRLSDEAIQWLRLKIKTTVKLDVLMMLYWNSGRPWGAKELASRLKQDPLTVAAGLVDLNAECLLECIRGNRVLFQFQPLTNHELSMRLQEVAILYRADRASVAGLLATGAPSFPPPDSKAD